MAVDTQTLRDNGARVRGTVATRIVAELVTRLAGGDGWEFAAFGRNDEIIFTAASTQHAADVAAMRAEIRAQRFAGSSLPHVGVALTPDTQRSLFVLFGEFGDRVAALRIMRPVQQKTYSARDGASIEKFFRQHCDAITAAIFDINGKDADRVAHGRAAPIAFLIDAGGALVSTVDEPDEALPSLRSLLLPRNGEIPTVLRSVIAELLERYHAKLPASDFVCVLPFALVRLAPLRSGAFSAALLITVEWLRSRASLEVTAAQYSISKRELQVLSSMLRGAQVSEIAAELSISESTVVFHLKRMLKKTLSRNRTELAARMLGYQIPQAS